MKEMYTLAIGALLLILGVPIGNLLARHTKDEQKIGQFWFKILILLSFLGAAVSLFVKQDILLYTFLFIAIVTSRSLKNKK